MTLRQARKILDHRHHEPGLTYRGSTLARARRRKRHWRRRYGVSPLCLTYDRWIIDTRVGREFPFIVPRKVFLVGAYA